MRSPRSSGTYDFVQGFHAKLRLSCTEGCTVSGSRRQAGASRLSAGTEPPTQSEGSGTVDVPSPVLAEWLWAEVTTLPVSSKERMTVSGSESIRNPFPGLMLPAIAPGLSLLLEAPRLLLAGVSTLPGVSGTSVSLAWDKAALSSKGVASASSRLVTSTLDRREGWMSPKGRYGGEDAPPICTGDIMPVGVKAADGAAPVPASTVRELEKASPSIVRGSCQTQMWEGCAPILEVSRWRTKACRTPFPLQHRLPFSPSAEATALRSSLEPSWPRRGFQGWHLLCGCLRT
mmetsp:Transcript_37468/g.105801  ORF Transcript_37468/g.105801 Transcript_37468/m.105801 type:complete len:288 (+) Transcript_37468:1064-1927(+)